MICDGHSRICRYTLMRSLFESASSDSRGAVGSTPKNAPPPPRNGSIQHMRVMPEGRRLRISGTSFVLPPAHLITGCAICSPLSVADRLGRVVRPVRTRADRRVVLLHNSLLCILLS